MLENIEIKKEEKTLPPTIDTNLEYIISQIKNFWIPDIQDQSIENNQDKKQRAYYIQKVDNHLELGICKVNYIY